MLTIFVGNLSPETCVDNLRERYARHGVVHLPEGNQERRAARRHAGSSGR